MIFFNEFNLVFLNFKTHLFFRETAAPQTEMTLTQSRPVKFLCLAFQFYTHLFSSKIQRDKRVLRSEEGGSAGRRR